MVGDGPKVYVHDVRKINIIFLVYSTITLECKSCVLDRRWSVDGQKSHVNKPITSLFTVLPHADLNSSCRSSS